MSARYALAKSICQAAGWESSVISEALRGHIRLEVDERLTHLRIPPSEHQSILDLAKDLCTAVADVEQTRVRVVASRPNLAGGSSDIWSLGQEWLEIIRGAKKSLVLISPSMDAAAVLNLLEALTTAYEDGVRIALLYGALGRLDRLRAAITLIKESCPDISMLEWPTARGFLHAKAICADDSKVYVGSANLTEFGWEKNVEVGVTLSGPAAQPLIKYCSALFEIARNAHSLRPCNQGGYLFQGELA